MSDTPSSTEFVPPFLNLLPETACEMIIPQATVVLMNNHLYYLDEPTKVYIPKKTQYQGGKRPCFADEEYKTMLFWICDYFD